MFSNIKITILISAIGLAVLSFTTLHAQQHFNPSQGQGMMGQGGMMGEGGMMGQDESGQGEMGGMMNMMQQMSRMMETCNKMMEAHAHHEDEPSNAAEPEDDQE